MSHGRSAGGGCSSCLLPLRHKLSYPINSNGLQCPFAKGKKECCKYHKIHCVCSIKWCSQKISMLRLQQQCSFWIVLFIQVLLTLSLSLSELFLETFRRRIPKKVELSLCKQWTRQLKSCHRLSGDHQICASLSDEQAHPLNCLIQVGLLKVEFKAFPRWDSSVLILYSQRWSSPNTYKYKFKSHILS